MKSARTSTPQLDGSGGILLGTGGREIAKTGIDRISVGAITHHAVSLDVGFDIVSG